MIGETKKGAAKMLEKVKILGMILSGTFFLFGCDKSFEVDEDSLIQICVKTGKYSQACGSGFWISPEYIVTAEHVVHNRINEKLKITASKAGEDFKPKKAEILKVDSVHDLALIRVNDYKSESWLEFCDNLYVFDQVYIARVTDEYLSIQYGFVNYIDDFEAHFTTKAWDGWSGSPVINSKLECVESILIWAKKNNNQFSGGPLLEDIKYFLEND